MKHGLHCYVAGQVQGVFFRMETCRRARDLGLTGWVRNLSDGRVEVMAYGEERPLERLRDWLRRGPELAHVTRLDTRSEKYREETGFRIR